MKIPPPWIYDKAAKTYHVIPYHLMVTFGNGEKGFYADRIMGLWPEDEAREFYHKFRNYFVEYEEDGFCTRLVFKGEKQSRAKRFLTTTLPYAALFGGVVATGTILGAGIVLLGFIASHL